MERYSGVTEPHVHRNSAGGKTGALVERILVHLYGPGPLRPPRARFAYDHGDLEIMTVSLGHERIKKRMAMMIEAAAWVMEVPLIGTGTTTLKIEMKKRGLEPDESYYIAHAAALRRRG